MDKNQLQSRKINTGTDLTALYGVYIVHRFGWMVEKSS